MHDAPKKVVASTKEVSRDKAATSHDTVNVKPGKVIVNFTVDWEGEALEEKHLGAMAAFRKAFPKIPLTHFICPAYFVDYEGEASDIKEGNKKRKTRNAKANIDAFKKQIFGPVILKTDELALHMHCPASLLTACKVQPPSDKTRSFEHETYEKEKVKEKESEPGQNVCLCDLDPGRIMLLIGNARGLLKSYLGGKPIGIRAGGWFCNDKVLDALAELGFAYDSSVPGEEVFLGDADWFDKWLTKIWDSKIDKDPFWKLTHLKNVPYTVESKPEWFVAKKKRMIEMPNNGALLPIEDAKGICKQITDAVKRAKETSALQYVNTGFHQECAGDDGQLDKLRTALGKLIEEDADVGKLVEFKTVSQSIEDFAGKK